MITINANAKINLTLDILGKRSDGYHEVAMVMQEIGLCDIISLERKPAGIELTMDKAELPADNTNLAYKAAQLFLAALHINSGVAIDIKKSIPIAAGLAGGSADAAGVLRGMNELFSTGLTTEMLCKIGEKLGSDVPFCICGGTMLATGRGEILKRLPPIPECYVVLAKPKVAVSTAWAYKMYDECETEKHPDNVAIISALESGNITQVSNLLGNVLEDVTCRAYKEIDEYKRIMLQNGATAAMMSGSGPTVFAIAESLVTAEKIASAIREKADAEAVHVVKTVQ